MKQEINPKETSRAVAFELWMKSPMPMVTLTKTFDVTQLRKVSRWRGAEIQHAALLVHWQNGLKDRGVLHAAPERKTV